MKLRYIDGGGRWCREFPGFALNMSLNPGKFSRNGKPEIVFFPSECIFDSPRIPGIAEVSSKNIRETDTPYSFPYNSYMSYCTIFHTILKCDLIRRFTKFWWGTSSLHFCPLHFLQNSDDDSKRENLLRSFSIGTKTFTSLQAIFHECHNGEFSKYS